MVLKIAGTFLEAPEAGAFNVYKQRQYMGLIGDMSRRRAKEERRVKILNEKGFWEGGVIPNTCSDIGSLASSQL